MTLDAYMAQLTSVAATGERIGRHMVLAVDTSAAATDTSIGDYTVVAYHIDNLGAALAPETEDKAYIGEGKSTIKKDKSLLICLLFFCSDKKQMRSFIRSTC